MRSVVLGLLVIAACSEDTGRRHLPPETAIDDKPAAITNQTHARIAFHAEGQADRFTCQLDAIAAVDCTSPFEADVTDGDHTFVVTAAIDDTPDPTPAMTTWKVDTVPPDTMVVSAPPALDNALAPEFRFAGTDDNGAVTFECALDDAAFAACTSPSAPAVTDGSRRYRMRAVDAAGNRDPSPAEVTWVVDSTAPDTTITAGPTSGATTGASVSFSFSSPDSPVTLQCSLDGAAFATCTSPRALTLAEGQHTFAVRARDTGGLVDPTPASRTWMVDTTAPAVVFDDAPPAQWPVSYYDIAFHATDPTATLMCAFNSTVFAPCTSPVTVSAAYNVATTFQVRATDAVGNSATASRTWTARDGLVLHYPWEQGQTHNTSLLAQRPAYSPDGAGDVPITGGWAGTAARAPRDHTYRGTIRALSSSVDGGYTASAWVRLGTDGNGTVLSTLTGDGGFALLVSGRQVQLRVGEGGQLFTANAVVPPGEWVQLGVLTTGPGRGLQLLVNGNAVATAQPRASTGFGAGQAPDLTVGALNDADVDDLRFYNRALAGGELCSVLVRGQLNAAGACVPLTPGVELDFEGGVVRDTGAWGLPFVAPQETAFVTTTLGSGLRLPSTQTFGYSSGLANQLGAAPGHSLSFWFVAGSAASDTLVDFFHPCAAGVPPTCGIRVTHSADGLVVTAGGLGADGSLGTPVSRRITTTNGLHSVVITERKAAGSSITQSLTVYLDGVATVMQLGAFNVFAAPSDAVTFARAPGMLVDEYEFWPRDLSLDPEMLCENGWDGEWNHATGSCALTSNPR